MTPSIQLTMKEAYFLRAAAINPGILRHEGAASKASNLRITAAPFLLVANHAGAGLERKGPRTTDF